MTKRMLQQAGITYTETDLTQNPAALEKVKKLGYLSAPVVITDKGQSWAGFQPERIKELTS